MNNTATRRYIGVSTGPTANQSTCHGDDKIAGPTFIRKRLCTFIEKFILDCAAFNRYPASYHNVVVFTCYSLVSSPPAFHEPFNLPYIDLEPPRHRPVCTPHVAPYDCVAVTASKLASSDRSTPAQTDHVSQVDVAARGDDGLTDSLDVGTITGQCFVLFF